ncbi:alpha/beta hydrolase [Aeromicrobium halocynthiae]|uniref:Alpha/beta hydrolase n=1 Tax=Aeromicrobium halocynthiae TaxID=560557 RepID=A0ABN2VQ66_9ACTN
MSERTSVGTDLAHERTGHSGPVVVALHGLTSSRRRERLMRLDVTEGLAGVRRVAYDARGHGRSPGVDDPAAYRWPALAEDLLSLLDDVAPSEPVHAVGSSMGAATALHAAVRQPSRFASLTLMLPPTAWTTRATKAGEYEAAAVLVETEGVQAWVDAGRDVPEPPAVRGRPETEPDVLASILPSVLRGAAASDLPDPERLAALSMPCLVLAWVDDPAHPLDTADALARLLPDVRTRIASEPHDVRGWTDDVARFVHDVESRR